MAEQSDPRGPGYWCIPPVTYPDDEWLSQSDAARELGISRLRVVGRIFSGHLASARSRRGESGVTRASVAKDREWLATASRRAKFFRAFADLFLWWL
ncbi:MULTISPECIES: DNA-binding protein [Actinomycetes]|uniref:DNA-binding protein n=2 Tax=Actinomycetes TaxID=1760 RepID=A0ABN3LCU2_9ACTN|nr:DNA-binding protein [Streptomyces sp. CMSTAAHL-2]MCE3033305.1 DNA-binding protein [Streptomyces sp. CMSTAAHL-2]